VILIGRRTSALEEVAKSIGQSRCMSTGASWLIGTENKYGVDTKIVTVDVSKPTEQRASVFMEIEKMVQGLDLGVLVNNVGASHEMPVDFAETDPEEMDTIIQTVSLASSGTLRGELCEPGNVYVRPPDLASSTHSQACLHSR
jgi:17beta-estradiol 17-dehydrogenase / very-long-chain 3-oxoacyl-CoA reductase